MSSVVLDFKQLPMVLAFSVKQLIKITLYTFCSYIFSLYKQSIAVYYHEKKEREDIMTAVIQIQPNNCSQSYVDTLFYSFTLDQNILRHWYLLLSKLAIYF